jgi:hypothetical protein
VLLRTYLLHLAGVNIRGATVTAPGAEPFSSRRDTLSRGVHGFLLRLRSCGADGRSSAVR